MASTPADSLAQFISNGVSGILKLAVHLLLLNARPWRYAASARFRRQFDEHHGSRSTFFKWLSLLWGAIILVGAITCSYFGFKLAALLLSRR